MYTTLEEAKEEVWKRWNDVELQQRVLAYVGELPEGFGREFRAVLVRHLATPNFETLKFVDIVRKIGLKPCCAQFTEDKFCSNNQDKLCLAKVIFYHGKGKHDGRRITTHHVINYDTEDGKSFQNIKTVWGQDFIAFHHQMLIAKLPGLELTEISRWLKKMGGTPELFYHRYLALFICHGIMFENFLNEGDEGKFTRKIVRPAIQKVTEHFGLKPLIVQLLPAESEADAYWCWYPGHLEGEVKALLAGGEGAAKRHAAEGATAVLTQNCNPSWK